MAQCRPAVRIILLFCTGILLGSCVPLSPALLFFLFLFLLITAGIMHRGKDFRFAYSILLHGLVIVLGSVLHSLQRSDFQTKVLQPDSMEESVTLYGTIETEPQKKEKRITCIVRSDSLSRKRNIERTAFRILTIIRLKKTDPDPGTLDIGRRVEINGMLESFPFQRNPGEFDYGKYLAINDIQGVVSTYGGEGVRVHDQGEIPLWRYGIYKIQRVLFRIIDSLHTTRHAGFLKGIIFGSKTDLPDDVKQSFLATGTIHILAVSGSNVAFVAFMVYSFLGIFRMPRKVVRGATIAVLLLYMMITGASPSVVRATIMAGVILCGMMVERKPDMYNSISVAGLLLLLWDTNILFDVGFQLSFSAVLSIVYFYPHLESLIKKIPERFEEIKAVDMLLKLFAVSLAAQMGTVPITAYYFGRVSVISLLANIPVVPISGLNTFLGFTELMSYGLSPWIAYLYAGTNDFLIWFLLGFIHHAAEVPYAYIEVWSFPVSFILAYYLFVISIFHIHRKNIRPWILIGFMSIGSAALVKNLWTDSSRKLLVTLIDVGQGDAIFLQCPNGKCLLVDTGPGGIHGSAGEKTIVPFLKRKNISHLDYMVITHAHNDHSGGAPAILRSIAVDTLFMNLNSEEERQMQEVFSEAGNQSAGRAGLRAGDQIGIDPAVRVYVLYPEELPDREMNRNNSSIVLKVCYGKTAILLTGDAEKKTEERMVVRYGKFLSSEILKLGHHGSHSSSSTGFLQTVFPRTALISVGNHNKFRHPAQSTLEKCYMDSIHIRRTDRDGAICMESDGNEWREWRWR